MPVHSYLISLDQMFSNQRRYVISLYLKHIYDVTELRMLTIWLNYALDWHDRRSRT